MPGPARLAPPRNVIFDVGNVLLRWDPKALMELEVANPALRESLLQEIFLHPDWTHLDHGILEQQQADLQFARRTGVALAEVERLIRRSQESLVPMEPGMSLLEELARRQVPLYCLTNMAVSTYAYLSQRYRFWSHFRGVVVSAHVRMIKPDPAIFLHLLERYQLDAADTAFLDDNPANVAAARSVGLHSRVFDSSARDWLLQGAP